MDKRKIGRDSWIIRRRIITLTLIFCASMATIILFKDSGSETESALVYSLFGLASAVIGSYIFGATWDDINRPRADD